MISKLCSCKLLCRDSTGHKRGNTNKKMDGQPKELISPNWWVNHNKDICQIKNYYTDRNHAELILFRQEMQIEDSCEFCLTCDKCKKYLKYSKEYKNKRFWMHNEKVRVWEIFDPDWSYKNEVSEIKPCNL